MKDKHKIFQIIKKNLKKKKEISEIVLVINNLINLLSSEMFISW